MTEKFILFFMLIKKRRKERVLVFPLAYLLLISTITCDVIKPYSKVLTPKNISDPKTIFSKSYIQKFSSSWHKYAKANDIARREKLKQALKDALTSIEDRKKSQILSNIDNDTVSRIKHAANLLKEFKRMYSLSENVKKTLQSYNEAKSNITDIAKSDEGFDLLKRFLVNHKITTGKRNKIPNTNKNFIEQVIEETDDAILWEKAAKEIQKRTLIASAPHLFNKKSFLWNPESQKKSTSFKKARIVLNYMAKKYGNNPLKKHVIEKLIKQLDEDANSATCLPNNNVRKTEFPRPGQEAGLSQIIRGPVTSVGLRDDTIESLLTGDEVPTHLQKKSTYERSNLPKKELTEKKLEKNKSTVGDKKDILPIHKRNSTLVLPRKKKKRPNRYVIAMLRNILAKFSKMNHKNKSSFEKISRKDETPLMKKDKTAEIESTNTTNNSSELTSITDASAAANETSINSTLDGNSNSTSQQESREMEILRKINDESFEEELDKHFSSEQNENNTLNKTTDTSTAENSDKSQAEKSKLEEAIKNAINDTEKELSNTENTKSIEKLEKDDEKLLQDEISSKLKDLQNDKLEISKTSDDLFGKKSSSKEIDMSKLMNPHPTDINDELTILKKQQDTMKQLREAKIAKQKYEIAKHELATKIKELYMMANEYEKQETSDQILEVKNFVKNSKSKNNVEKDDNNKEYVESHNFKRDESHPGIALTNILKHPSSLKKTLTEDDKHKVFTMGMGDSKLHSIVLPPEVKPTPAIKKVYDLPTPLRIDKEIKPSMLSLSAVPKKKTSQEETLKVIAQAIKEDMDEISKNEQKKKILKFSHDKELSLSKIHLMPTNKTQFNKTAKDVSSRKKGFPGADKIDEYLTKALAEFMGNDSITDIFNGRKDEKDKEDIESKNRKIVEKAMRQHAKNPDMPLPLVKNAKGDKLVLNKENDSKVNNTFSVAAKALKQQNNSDTLDRSLDKAVNLSSNDIFSNGSDKKKSHNRVEIVDPAERGILDKASHMEEKIAAAQDKLYSDKESPVPEGLPEPLLEKNLPKTKEDTSASQPLHSLSKSMYSNFQNDPYSSIHEHAETPPHGLSPESPPARPFIHHTPEALPAQPELPVTPELPPRAMQHLAPELIVPPQRISPDEEEEQEDREQDESDDDEEEEELRHRHSKFIDEEEPENGEEEEDDEDDEEEDKKSRVRYRNEVATKRSELSKNSTLGIANGAAKSSSSTIISSPKTHVAGNPTSSSDHLEELEDRKRDTVPNINFVQKG